MKLTTRKFGVEIEVLRKSSMTDDEMFDEIVVNMTAAGLDVRNRGYTHSITPYWKILTDASCGLELVSPPLSGDAGLHEIEIACKVLTNLNYQVDKSTGLHVHHDARNLTRDQITGIFATAMKWETVMDHLVAPSRVNNRFCQSNAHRRPETASYLNAELASLRSTGAENFNMNGYDRYLKVNYQAYLRHGTIEFRQHQGTTEAAKIIHWVIVTQNLITRTLEHGVSWRAESETAISFKRFRDMLGCSGITLENNEYVKQAARTMIERFRKFANGLTPYESALGHNI